jgi:hypothetical protein
MVRLNPANPTQPLPGLLCFCAVAAMAISLTLPFGSRSYSGVDEPIGDVNKEIRHQHRDHDQEGDPLNQGVVALSNGTQQ